MKNLERTLDEMTDPYINDPYFKVPIILFPNPVLTYMKNRIEGDLECQPNQNTINRAAWLYAFALYHALEEELDWVHPMISTHAPGTMVITWTHFRDFHRELLVEISPTVIFHVYIQKHGEPSIAQEFTGKIPSNYWHGVWGWLLGMKGYDIF